MRKESDIKIYDRLEIFHLEAYFIVKRRTAEKKRALILLDLEEMGRKRRSKILTFWDLAIFDGYELPEDIDLFMEKVKSRIYEARLREEQARMAEKKIPVKKK